MPMAIPIINSPNLNKVQSCEFSCYSSIKGEYVCD
jgi:hypothetical protein